MSANIRVESGISAGTKVWIDRPVLRIGSDPQCDVCLLSAELAPHAITLEFRDGNYRAYNRSQSPVNIGSTVVQPGANAVWQADDTLQLPGDLRLALEIDGDPRPAPRPDSQYDDGFDDEVASLPIDAIGRRHRGRGGRQEVEELHDPNGDHRHLRAGDGGPVDDEEQQRQK